MAALDDHRIVRRDGIEIRACRRALLRELRRQPPRACVDQLTGRRARGFLLDPGDRFSVAGAKDDRRDAFVLADSLRTYQPSFRRLHLDEPQLLLLRELSRAEETLRETSSAYTTETPTDEPCHCGRMSASARHRIAAARSTVVTIK